VLAGAVAVGSLAGIAGLACGCLGLAFGLLAKEWALVGAVLLPLCAYAQRRAAGGDRRAAARRAALVAASCAVVAAAYLLVRARALGGALTGYTVIEPDWSDAGYWLSRARFLAGVAVPVPWARSEAWTIAAWAGLSLAAAVACVRRRPRVAAASLALGALAAAAHYQVEYVPETMQDARYAFACTVVQCVAVAVLLAGLTRARPGPRRRAGWLAVALAGAFWLASGQPLRRAWTETAAQTSRLAGAMQRIARAPGAERPVLLAIPTSVGGARLGHALPGGALSATFCPGPVGEVACPRNDVLGPSAVLAAYVAAAGPGPGRSELWSWSIAKGDFVPGSVAAAVAGLEDQRLAYCGDERSRRPSLVVVADRGRTLVRVAREPGARAVLVAGPPGARRHVSACDDLCVWPAVSLGSAREDDPLWLEWDVTGIAERRPALQALVVPRHGLPRLSAPVVP
jgi:hypothetical protein